MAIARRHARGGIEAEDLLHDALAAALVARRDLGSESRAWLFGTMRNLAAMGARTAARRRKREARVQAMSPTVAEPATATLPALEGLVPSLRIVALLALSGHTRAEIRHLLRISDEALRQRIAGVRRVWSGRVGASPADFPGLGGGLAFGSIRRSLLPLMRAGVADFASHDPDGHPIAFRFSTSGAHEKAIGGN